MKTIINSRTLKLIAIVTMVIDHIGLYLLPNIIVFRIVGRIAMPCFCFLIAFGSCKTRSNLKYFLRLLTCAILFQPLYSISKERPFYWTGSLNVFFTLALGAFVIMLIKNLISYLNNNQHPVKSACIAMLTSVIIGGIFCLAWFLPFNYGVAGILLMVALFFMFYIKNRIIANLVIIASMVLFNIILVHISHVYSYLEKPIIQWYSCIAIIFMILFSQKHIKTATLEKYAFYLFYPVHLLILYGIGFLI